MNLDFYNNYIKIVECGTLSSAARALHIAQSALSSQVKQFEKEFGAVLFIRNARKMELTDAGRILYEKAKNIVLLEDAAHKEISAYVEGAKGTIRIGMTQAYPDITMTKLLLEFQKENPMIRYEFYEVSSNEIINLLQAGVIEIGIIRSSTSLPPFLKESLHIRQKLCAYCSYKNPWITPYSKEVVISSLDQVPLAISRGFQDVLTDLFVRSNIQPIIMSVSTSRSTPMMWAQSGAAIAIICTDDTENWDNTEIFCRPLAIDDPLVASELNVARSFITAKGRTLSAAAQKFLNYSKKSYLS